MYYQTHTIGKSQINKKQRKVSKYSGTRRILSIASLLMIADVLVREVQSRKNQHDEILSRYQQDT
jgi:type II secretory pathway component PulL